MKRTSAPNPYSKRQKTAPVPAKAFFKKKKGDFPELKFKDTTKAATTSAAAGSIFNDTLCGLAEGNTDQTRIGNKVTAKSIMLRGAVQLGAATSTANAMDIVRILVYLDKQANGATAAVTDILAAADYNAFNNLDNSDRFRTLAEHSVTVVCPGVVASGAAFTSMAQLSQPFFMKAKLNLAMKYKANNGTILDLAGANIGVLVISRNGLATVEYIARFKYTDA